MFTLEQISKELIGMHKYLSRHEESLKSAHKRLDDNDQVINGIHKLAANMEALTLQVKILTEGLENNLTKIESKLKIQGERIGDLESKSGKRWESIVSQFIGIAVAGIGAFLLARLGMKM